PGAFGRLRPQAERAGRADVETIQQREGRWVLADLEGKGRRIRTVALPIWVKHGINAWMTAARHRKWPAAAVDFEEREDQSRHVERLAVWSVVEQSSKQIGIEHFRRQRPPGIRAKLC